MLGLLAGALAVEAGLLGLGLGLRGRARGGLSLSAGALRGLGRAARLARAAQVAVDGALEPLPGAGLLLPLPEGGEAIDEQLAPGLEVDGEHVEAAVGGPVRCLGGEPRIEVRRLPRPLPDRLGVASLQLA